MNESTSNNVDLEKKILELKSVLEITIKEKDECDRIRENESQNWLSQFDQYEDII